MPAVETERLRVLMLAPERVVGGITSWWKIFNQYSNHDLIEYRVIDTSKLYEPLGRPTNIRGACLGATSAVYRFFKLLNSLVVFRPHVVYLNVSPGLGFLVRDLFYLLVLRIFCIPSVVHLHGGKIHGFFGDAGLRRWLSRAILKRCSAVVTLTRDIQGQAEEILGNGNVRYVPNMIDDNYLARASRERIPFSGGQLRFLNVGWQAPEKGTLDLLNALDLIEIDYRCDFVGAVDPHFRPEVELLISGSSLRGRVAFCGVKTAGDELDSFFRNADIFIFPSWSEGFPMALLEAMTWSLPIIATPVGNIPEMLQAASDGPVGVILAHSKDSSELAMAIQSLVDNQNDACVMGQRARARVQQKYLASCVVPQLEDILRSVSRRPA